MVGTGYRARGRIPIVEDDQALCGLLADALGDEGLEVACAHDDKTAYTVIPTLPTFRALVVDLDLGVGTTGFDVARFGRRVIPNVLVIYMSGATSNTSLEAFGVPGGHFLQKPFTPHELLRWLLQSLSSSEFLVRLARARLGSRGDRPRFSAIGRDRNDFSARDSPPVLMRSMVRRPSGSSVMDSHGLQRRLAVDGRPQRMRERRLGKRRCLFTMVQKLALSACSTAATVRCKMLTLRGD